MARVPRPIGVVSHYIVTAWGSCCVPVINIAQTPHTIRP
jgi:hypothetical protein